MTQPQHSTVLILDDDPGILMLQRRALERAGHVVFATTTYQAAFDQVRQQRPDLLLIDYRLGTALTGLDFYRQLRDQGIDLPAIMVTGFNDENKILEALRAGVRDVVPKGGDYLEYLPQAVARVLGQVRAEGDALEAAALRRSEAQLRALNAELERRTAELASAAQFPAENPQPVLRIAAEGQVLYANKAAEALLDREGWVRPGPAPAVLREPAALALASGREHEFEFFCRDERVMTFLCVPLADKSYVNLYGRDVTETRSAQDRVQQLNRDLAQRNTELETERARWQGIVEGIAEEVWTCDAEGKISLLNLGTVTALKLPEFKDKTVYQLMEEVEILTPDGQPRLPEQAPLLRSLRGEVVRGEEIMRHRQSGVTRWRHFSSAPVRDAHGRITGAVAITRDITEQKEAEAALRNSEQRLRATFNNAALGIVEVSGDDRVIDANERMCQILEYRREELIGKSIHELTAPEDRGQSDGLNAELHQGQRDRTDYEKRYLKRDGSPVWVRVAITALRDAAGAWVGSIGTVEDISQRKRAEEALRESEQFSRSVIEASLDCIKVLDLEGTLLSMSDGGQKLLEIDEIGKYLNTCWIDFWCEQDRPHVREAVAAARGGGVGRFQAFCPSAKGTPRWWDVVITPLPGPEGRPERLLSVSRDITEQKQQEQALADAKRSAEHAKAAAEEASRAKDHFLAVLSHELRTPLTPVVAAVSMLQQTWRCDERSRETLEMVRRNIEMEARLIDDLLDMTRIARGKIELDRKPTRLCDVIHRAVEVCKPDIEARRLEFGVDAKDFPYIVDGDATRLQQVFWNLLRNAIKFTPHGGCVGIRCRRVDGTAVIEVNDSGEGIGAEAMPRIFDAFEQAERSITRQFGGLGLGLTISKSLVELHGGSIEAHSDGKGKGATFRVRLPLVLTEPRVEPPPAAPPSKQRALRILLVEDHGDTAKMMRLLLMAEGHEVERAGDVATALEIAGKNTFDLLLSDLGLPDASGLDLMRELRQRGSAMPSIALSGYGQEEDIRRSKEAGFAAHLTKPTSPERLAETIAAITGRDAAHEPPP